MAESFTVVFKTAPAAAGLQVPFKNQTEASGGAITTVTGYVATVEAANAQEACTAVRRAYGDGVVTGKMRVAKTSNVEEKTA